MNIPAFYADKKYQTMAPNDSKYIKVPDNSYFNKRIAKGEKLTDIFDWVDPLYGCYVWDSKRPFKVRIDSLYNYVVGTHLLFDNWFVSAKDFENSQEVTVAYKRYDADGRLGGGVLITREGAYITTEEFKEVVFLSQSRYALVKQYDNLLNVFDIRNGRKLSPRGLDVDGIDYNDYCPEIGIFRVAKGLDTKVLGSELMYSKKSQSIKYNYFTYDDGLISPSLWFDDVESFMITSNYDEYNGHSYRMSNYAVVKLNNKYNFITQKGKLLSDTWFDYANVLAGLFGEAGILKSPDAASLPSFIEDMEPNPDKFVLYHIDKFGCIKKR